jgi:hypothetical protein
MYEFRIFEVISEWFNYRVEESRYKLWKINYGKHHNAESA